MEGKLFQYHAERRLVAFMSDPPTTAQQERQVVIFIGGLTDGFLATPYLGSLQARCSASGWSLVQVLLSSSYHGYGNSSLRQDVEELDSLVQHLTANENVSKVALLGHSTGCQDIVQFMKDGKQRDRVDAVILQAPVSDREYAASLPETASRLALATEMIAQQRGHEFMPREADPAPITAERYYSFAARLGDDDMFSSDFTPEEARARLGHVQVPALVYLSMRDEYVPESVDKEKLRAVFAHLPRGVIVLDDEANHNLSQPPGAGDRFAEEVLRFLRSVQSG